MAGGQQFASQQGSLGKSVTVALVGIGLTVSQGTLSPSVDSTNKQAALVGQAIAVQQGSLDRPRGQVVAVAIGALSVQRAVALVGQQLGVGQGSVADGNPNRSKALVGEPVAVQQGTISAPDITDTFVSLAQGTLSADRSVALVGQPVVLLTGAIGLPGAPVTLPLTGQALASAQGALGVQRRNAAVGSAMAADQGSVAASSNTPPAPPALSVDGPVRPIGLPGARDRHLSVGVRIARRLGGRVGRK